MADYTFDGSEKMISLNIGVNTLDIQDLYSRWKDWALLTDNSKWERAFETAGGEDIDVGAGTAIPLYAFLVNGWRIRPHVGDHTLNVINGVLLVSGGGDPFIDAEGSYVVRINYSQPVQAITFAAGVNLETVLKLLMNRTITDPSTGEMTLYDDDDETPLLTAGIYKDVAGSNPYDGTGAINRKDRYE